MLFHVSANAGTNVDHHDVHNGGGAIHSIGSDAHHDPHHASGEKLAIEAAEQRIRADIAKLRADMLNAVSTPGALPAPAPAVASSQAPAASEQALPQHKLTSQVSAYTVPGMASAEGSLFALAAFTSSGTSLLSAPVPPGGDLLHEETGKRHSRKSLSSRGSAIFSGNGVEDEDLGLGNAASDLYRGWPQNISLRSEFEAAGEEENMTALQEIASLLKEHHEPSMNTSSMLDVQFSRAAGAFRMLRPDSHFRLGFDVVSMVVLIFELVYTPFSLTWTISSGAGNAITYITTGFWLLDMFLSFMTGYSTSDGGIEMRYCKVACHYIRTWFPIDILCIMGDIINTMLLLTVGTSSANADGFSNVLRVAKLARFLRVLGMVRLFRVMSAFNSFMEAHLSEAWRMMVRILQITSLLVWIGHIVACIWYHIGKYGPMGSTGERWIDTKLGFEEVEIRDRSQTYQYFVAYHWGLAQITLGAHDVNPVNVWERIFTVICNLFGLLFGGTLVSILSTTLIDLREMNQEKTRIMRTLKSFLMQYDVVVGMRIRALQQVDERLAQRDNILVEKDVTALEMLSRSLHRELRFALFGKHVCTHPLLLSWKSVDAQSVKNLCSDPDGLELVLLLPDDDLFTAGSLAKGAYCIISGTVNYTLDDLLLEEAERNQDNALQLAQDGEEVDDSEKAEVGSWMSEAAWWCWWLHVGTAKCEAPCRLLCLSPENIGRALADNRSVAPYTRLYAAAFHQRIVKASPAFMPNDLRVHYTNFGDLVFSMPKEAQILIGLAALKRVEEKNTTMAQLLLGAGMKRLQQEVYDGHSTVVLNSQKTLQRHVSLVALMIRREEKTLVEVADYDYAASRWKWSCRLPGVKQIYGELPYEGVFRLIRTRLSQLGAVFDEVAPVEVVVTEEVHPSPQFGVDTTYSKVSMVHDCTDEIVQELRKTCIEAEGSWLLADSAAFRSTSQVISLPSFASHGFLFAPSRSSASASRVQLFDEVYALSGESHAGIYGFMKLDELNQLRDDMETQEKIMAVLNGRVEPPPPRVCSDKPWSNKEGKCQNGAHKQDVREERGLDGDVYDL
mmetsp:Transcript_60088/g.143180  ORF Transcript_60088/g.143180 Transcript_60088/m.143180 type:complete len:1070 (-) Transcript_60088:62-3271(-)